MRRFAPFFFAAALAVPAVAHADDPPATNDAAKTTTTTSAVSQADKDFVAEAAQGGLSEVKLGQLAQSKAQSESVKSFANKMITDHTKANDELKVVAQKKGLTVPTDVSSEQQKTYDDLAKLSGAEFDKAYMDTMVKDHDEDVAVFQKQAKSGKDKDIKNFAHKVLPTLENHKKMAHANASGTKKM